MLYAGGGSLDVRFETVMTFGYRNKSGILAAAEDRFLEAS